MGMDNTNKLARDKAIESLTLQARANPITFHLTNECGKAILEALRTPSGSLASWRGRPRMTHHKDTESIAKGPDLLMRRAEFDPPCWQIWDARGDRVLASFATRDLLDAAMPGLRNYLKDHQP